VSDFQEPMCDGVDIVAAGDSMRALVAALDAVNTAKAIKDTTDAAAKAAGRVLDEVEGVAIELLAMSGMDRVTCAGKTWWLRDFWGLSVPAENRQAVIEAVEAAGAIDLVTVNTTSLKAYLIEQAGEAAGEGIRPESIVRGTPFEGLVSEYREVRLNSRRNG